MFDYTKVAIGKTINDFKKTSYVVTLIMQVFYIAYLIYASFAGVGFLAINISLAVVSLAYLIFYLTTYDKKQKKLKFFTARAYKWFKLTINAFTLAVSLYGIYTAAKNVNPISIILATLMIITWILQLVMEIIVIIFENKKQFILEAFEADVEKYMKPVHAVTNFIDKVRGREIEEPKENKEPTKNRQILDRMVSDKRAEKAKETASNEFKSDVKNTIKNKFPFLKSLSNRKNISSDENNFSEQKEETAHK